MDISSKLPEECIADIISKTSPPDASRMSLVSRTFSSVAASNLVWEAFLPPDHQQIISESVSSSPSLNILSKKDLYFSLCDNPILIGTGNRIFGGCSSCECVYGAYLIYTIGDRCRGLARPVKLSVRFLDEIRCDFINAHLLSTTSMDIDAPEEEDARFPRDREDKWMEIEMGEFFNYDQVDRVVEMQLRETEVLNWKSGLVIHGIEVRPKDLR
ncbi:hypothetical protein I3760_01G119700 [Carya illinoinensis]|nr:hypothetical protein I3760_01G119700 [Carya illinoinensis]